MTQPIARHRIFPVLAALLSIVIILGATWFVTVSENERQVLQERMDTLQQMSLVRASIEKALWSTVLSVQPVISHVSIHGEIDHETFQSIFKEASESNPVIRTASLIKGSSVIDVYPSRDNERAIEAELAEIHERRETLERLIQTRGPVISGPFELVHGGLGILCRIPVFLATNAKTHVSGDYWGQVCVVIPKNGLFEGVGTTDSSSGSGYALRSRDVNGTGESFSLGDEKIFKSDPVVLDINVPGGVWEMAALPGDLPGPRTSRMYGFMAIGGFLSLFTGWLTWSWLVTKEKFEQRLYIQRKLIEKSQASEAKYRTVFESSTDAMLILREDKFLDCNTASLQMFGCARHQLLGSSPLTFSPVTQPDGEDSASKNNRKMVEALSGQPQFFEWKCCRYDRTTFDAEISLVSLQVHGELILHATIRDITDRKRAENEIRNSVSLLRSTLESTADGVVVISREGRISAFNQRFLDQWIIPQEIMDSGNGNRVLAYILDQVTNPEVFRRAVKASYDEPEIESFDVMEFKDGRVFERYSRPQLIANAVVGRVWNFRDVTEKRRAEQELRAARDELETRVEERTNKLMNTNQELEEKIAELNRTEWALKQSHGNLEIALSEASMLRVKAEAASSAKSEFLANMSHELRSPLTAVIGFSDLLGEQFVGKLNEKQSLYVQNISEAGRHLLTLINDILDLAKIEAGKIELNPSAIDLNELLDRCSVMVREMAVKRGLNFDVTVSEDLKKTKIQADEVRIKQMVINLLSNAIKFTPSGGTVQLVAELHGADIRIIVSDTGIGLRPQDQERIFGAFEQVDSSYSRQEPGTGLGLALVRTLAQLHGGSASVRSDGEGKGSAFTVTFPCIFAGQPAETEPTPEPFDHEPEQIHDLSSDDKPDVKILVVEDNENNMKVTTGLLESRGYCVLQAFSAEQAIGMVETYTPHLILMDISLPGMDGLSATRILKSNPASANIPVAALTAHAMIDDRTRAMEAGCDAYILKPIDSVSFFITVSELTKCDQATMVTR